MTDALEHDVRRSNGALKARAASVMHDVEELRKDVGRLADAASEAAEVRVRSTGRRLSRMSRKAQTRMTEGAEYVSEQVREHPGVAIGASLGAGLLIGMLLSRNHAD
jgi:ElaB/YqjD/DUF883 family membrane-anchored ribosome-binding protein